ncbi:MAG: hypothetical protein WAZ77_06385 [Candidatus Nitrosopolaris sp.]
MMYRARSVTTRMDVEENKIEDEEHGHSNSQKKRQLLSDKLNLTDDLKQTFIHEYKTRYSEEY